MDIFTCIVISALTASITTVALADRYLNRLTGSAKEVAELAKELVEKLEGKYGDENESK